MSEKLRLALVGCGWIAEAHMKAYQDLHQRGCREFEIVACCDTVEEKASAAAEFIGEFQGKKPAVYTSSEKLLKDNIAEAADLCLPHCFHHSVAIEMLQGGLHVLLEKPLGITIKASRKIIDAAEKNSRVLATAENTRRSPNSRAARWAICEAKMIGKVHSVYAQNISYGPFDMTDPKFMWRGAKMLTGGGLIMDSGAHFADMIMHLFGEPEDIYCKMHTVHDMPIKGAPVIGDTKVDIEDTWNVVINFAGGPEVVWSYSPRPPGRKRKGRKLLRRKRHVQRPRLGIPLLRRRRVFNYPRRLDDTAGGNPQTVQGLAIR